MVIVKLTSYRLYRDSNNTFTFQYGYSKTRLLNGNVRPVDTFTFQYGYSKTLVNSFLFLSSLLFTFQYGYSKTRE